MVLLLNSMVAAAQEFYNLTAQEVRIDSVLPLFTYTRDLGLNYADSIYTVSIDYPEFIDMSPVDIARLHAITSSEIPEMPVVEQYIGVSRKRGMLYAAFVPIVYREGKYQKLVSFKLSVKSQAVARARAMEQQPLVKRYADHSVLASGRWAKIRVPSTGVYQLTDALVKQAGFTNINKVKIYGYGGALQPEKLTADYLASTDDLHEVPTCNVGGRRLFYGIGPVSWDSNTATSRTRNPYSDYGYYFLTENDSTALSVDENTFKTSYYPQPDDYHTLYEVDDFAWYHGGRNLYDSRLFGNDVQRSYELTAPEGAKGQLTVVLTADGPYTAELTFNGKTLATLTNTSSIDSYSKALIKTGTYTLEDSLAAKNQVVIRQISGSSLRLDYLSLQYDTPQAWPELATDNIPVPEYVYNITNQDHHADTAVDMVIIIPTTQKLLSEAQRLKAFHKEHDSLRVRIVPADELFNEFASGTPDANAYRRYLKMLYDRAESDDDMPRYLMLFGDGGWDNRMLTNEWKGYSPDDFLLCYESENSFSETDCYVTDDYFCLMDDNEGGDMLATDKPDVAVGRFSARTTEQAQILVDKTIAYANNTHAGAWQNTICFLGDDGDSNRHMNDADAVATMVAGDHPALNIRKVYWDSYQRQSSSTGFSYPEVTQLVQQQMKNGALMINYSGHGAAYTMSHEQAVNLADFELSSDGRLPMWLTASCDIMPFDGQEENIGETAMFNKQGGAIAFYGTTRTVYAHYNGYMNRAYTKYVLDSDDQGRRYTIGEAARLAKNLLMTATGQGNTIGTDRTTNKLQYTLLGDPALTLALPTMQAVIDSIGNATSLRINVGQPVLIKGHIVGATDFNGVVTVTVRDIEKTITCRLNDASAAEEPFTYTDRPGTLYEGSDSVRNGHFSLQFVLPKDISYSDGTGLITLYAVSSDKKRTAHGYLDTFTMGSEALDDNDGVGPNIYCYLNSPSFVNGGNVNTTPYFYAEISDKDGINASGNGIGHDMELIIESTADKNEMLRTYVLNDYFQYDFGNYRSGSLGYTIPQLNDGPYKLMFRAWDAMGNSSTTELQFNVVKALEPSVFDINATRNPASSETTFVITHDRIGSDVDIQIDVFDTSGRQLWCHKATGVSASQPITVNWDLTTSGGHRLTTGVYLYRVLLSSDGSSQASKAKKLIIVKK